MEPKDSDVTSMTTDIKLPETTIVMDVNIDIDVNEPTDVTVIFVNEEDETTQKVICPYENKSNLLFFLIETIGDICVMK